MDPASENYMMLMAEEYERKLAKVAVWYQTDDPRYEKILRQSLEDTACWGYTPTMDEFITGPPLIN